VKEPKVIIQVNCGVVQGIFSNIHDLDVIVLDYDCIDSWGKKQHEAKSLLDYVTEQRNSGNNVTEFIEVY